MAEKLSEEKLRAVCAAFCVDGELTGVEPLTMGNINTACKVTVRGADGTLCAYVVQKVNTYVFKNPAQIMENIDLVSTHLLRRGGGVQLAYQHTPAGKNYLFEEDGSFWRLYTYIDAETYDTCDDLGVLRGAGRAFGAFQAALSDFDARRLHETIPDFHNTAKRLETFFSDVSADPCGRVCEVGREIDFIASLRERASVLSALQAAGALPIRVTHNDTKTNNVLFDRRTHEPLTVIDLDTVMPGLAMHDFGDAVRSAANTASEDEEDLSKVSLNIDKFKAFTDGFIGETAHTLTEAELDVMALGALSITVELGVRFLDDYLTGDQYFRIRYPAHNLVRARGQLKLAADMREKYDEMQSIVRSAARR